MSLETFIQNYIEVKEVTPSNNELLDLIQRYYISGKISIAEYRDLFKALHLLGAEKPTY